MIIQPKIRGFICTTAHPKGCELHVQKEIQYCQSKPINNSNTPKKVLIIGASSGYGLSSRIVAAFGCKSSTIGVFFEKEGTERRTATAGWYNAYAFDKAATEAGLYAKSFNVDAFSYESKQKVIDTIKEDWGTVDLIIYSLASPVRKLPDTQEIIRSSLKPINTPYHATAVDTNTDKLFEASIEPANEKEIQDTITVMGGQDWELWIKMLSENQVLAKNAQTIAYSYIGTEITWPIYWNGTLGEAKKDLDRASIAINTQLQSINGKAKIAVLKSVVTQASAAIPVMPLYIAMVFKKMKMENVHEDCIEQIYRLFNEYITEPSQAILDKEGRYRVDNYELRTDIQEYCKQLWSRINDDNLKTLTDYQEYKILFMRLFGFQYPEIDYTLECNPMVPYSPMT